MRYGWSYVAPSLKDTANNTENFICDIKILDVSK